MNTQILSKNELVINAEETQNEKMKKKMQKKKKKKKAEKENKNKNTNGHGKHGEKKGKTGGTTIELSTNTAALSKKPNKSEAKTQ